MIFLIALAALVVLQLRRDIRITDRLSPTGFWRSPIKRAGVVFLLLAVVPMLFVQLSPYGGALQLASDQALYVHLFLSFLISYTWYRYLTWLDTFEREPVLWESIVFILSCGSTFLTFPLSAYLIPKLGLALGNGLLGDWWFAFIGVGLIEETVKLLPLLLLLIFTRQADEPFDVLLYASISALGFAFVENTLYLADSALTAVGGRVLYASVAHMVFSSIIAYCIVLAKRNGIPWGLGVLGGLLLASAAHGFYDLWLFGKGRPAFLTLLFFLGNIHLWVVMKNNLINLSPNYQQRMRPQSVMFRYRMINALAAIFLFTYVLKFLLEGRSEADALLRGQGSTMGATLLFLSISLSSFRFVPGVVSPLLPEGRWWRLLLPRVDWGEDLSGRQVLLRIPEKRSRSAHYMTLHQALPLQGELIQRMDLNGDSNWYFFRPALPVPFTDRYHEALLVRPERANDGIPEDRYILVSVLLFKGPPDLLGGPVRDQDLEVVGVVHGRLLA
jgi:RsiW-degrading membrane proteinase PrsW (M82 family)